MAKKQISHLPEILLKTPQNANWVRGEVASGRLRRLVHSLYTSNVTGTPEDIIRRNLWTALGMLFPEAVISFRTALENRPAPDGTVFLTGPARRTVRLPGVTVRIIEGPGALPGDIPFVGGLHHASQARAFLENLFPARTRQTEKRAVSREEIERRLELIQRSGGNSALNLLRDRAKGLIPVLNALHAENAFVILSDIISMLSGTGQAKLTASTAAAALLGKPYDSVRMALFDRLLADLRSRAFSSRPDNASGGAAWQNIAFIDAYFSNYIEGTEFEIDEARRIVFNDDIPSGRPKDAHDVLGTYHLVVDRELMAQPAFEAAPDADSFLDLLRSRHGIMLAAREEAGPGSFKIIPNRAGSTFFVSPELVNGTLIQGYERYRSLETPFARAVFMHYLISETHPFTDGNGRIARVMMNAELVSDGESRSLITTVYRDNYISALRALSRNGYTEPIIEVLQFAQKFTHAIDFSSLDSAIHTLAQCNAFALSDDEVRLRMP